MNALTRYIVQSGVVGEQPMWIAIAIVATRAEADTCMSNFLAAAVPGRYGPAGTRRMRVVSSNG